MNSLIEKPCPHGPGCRPFRDLSGAGGFPSIIACLLGRYFSAPSPEKRLIPFHFSLPCGSAVVSASGVHGEIIIPLYSPYIWICRSSFGCRGSLSSGLSGGSGLDLGPECLASGPCQNHRGSALIANAIIRLTWPSTPLGPTHHHVDVPGRTSACHFGLPGARLLRRC